MVLAPRPRYAIPSEQRGTPWQYHGGSTMVPSYHGTTIEQFNLRPQFGGLLNCDPLLYNFEMLCQGQHIKLC